MDSFDCFNFRWSLTFAAAKTVPTNKCAVNCQNGPIALKKCKISWYSFQKLCFFAPALVTFCDDEMHEASAVCIRTLKWMGNQSGWRFIEFSWKGVPDSYFQIGSVNQNVSIANIGDTTCLSSIFQWISSAWLSYLRPFLTASIKLNDLNALSWAR